MFLVQVEDGDGSKICINVDNLATLRPSARPGYTDVQMCGVREAIPIKGEMSAMADFFRKATKP
jgi:hypothetical protein